MFKGSRNVITVLILCISIAAALICRNFSYVKESYIIFFIGLYLSLSPRIINEWEKGVLLRLGKFKKTLNPGIIWLIPGIDIITSIVDMRVRTTSFTAEKTLTEDTVPVDVDAVLFWVVFDAKRAILEVEDYQSTINWVAQTTLRDIIGSSELAKLISDRESLDKELQKILDNKTNEWGITVQSVEIRDVNIPSTLEDSMSRVAQAEREKEARIILSKSEEEVANQMKKAAKVYNDDPTSLQLRMMNMTYESIKEKGALMVVPTNMTESLSGNLGVVASGYKFQEKS